VFVYNLCDVPREFVSRRLRRVRRPFRVYLRDRGCGERGLFGSILEEEGKTAKMSAGRNGRQRD